MALLPFSSAPGSSGGLTKYARSATLVVAASNSKDTSNADYICTGTGDQSTINTAIGALPAGMGKIVLLDGLYNISGSINCGGGGGTSAVVFEGQGWNTQLKLTNSANCYMFDFGLANAPQFTMGLTMKDFYINCNGANQTSGGGIYARGAVWCKFDHLFIQTPYEAGIRFYQDGTGGYGHHNSIVNCLFRDGNNSPGFGWALKLEQADENHIIGCTFQDNGHSNGYGSTQIYDTAAGLQSIVGSSFVGGGTGVPFVFSDSGPGRISFSGNQFDGAHDADFLSLNGAGHEIIGNTFLLIGNNGTANRSGINIGVNNANLLIEGNSFYSSGAHAVAVTEGTGATGSVIHGNYVNGVWAAGPFITAASSTTRVSNNQGATNNTEPVTATITVAASNSAFPSDANYVCTGTNDNTTIQAAINALPASGGKVILSDGTFNIGATINITKKFVTLQGQGWGTYLKSINSLNNYMISVSGGTGQIEGVMLQDLYLDANSANQTSGSCLYFANTVQSYTKHVKIINVFNYCVVYDKLNGQDNYNNWITECEFSNAGGFINEGTGGTETNIYMNNYMFGAVGVAGLSYPIQASGGGATIINNQFGGNSNASNQSSYIRAGNTNPVKIIGNMFNNTSRQAIQILSGGHSVIGNTFIGIGQLAAQTYNAIEVWDSNNVISGNVFTAFTNYQLKDIAEQNNSGNGNTISNNTIATGITRANPYTKITSNTNWVDSPSVLSAASYTTNTGTSINGNTLNMFIVTAQAGALKFNNPSGTPSDGQKLIITVASSTTAARALTWDTLYGSTTVTLPTTTAATTATLSIGFIYSASKSLWQCVAVA